MLHSILLCFEVVAIDLLSLLDAVIELSAEGAFYTNRYTTDYSIPASTLWTESYNNCYYHIQAMAHVSTDAAWGKLLASIDVRHENERAKLRAKFAVAANAAEQSKAQPNLAPAAMSNTTTDTHAV